MAVAVAGGASAGVDALSGGAVAALVSNVGQAEVSVAAGGSAVAGEGPVAAEGPAEALTIDVVDASHRLVRSWRPCCWTGVCGARGLDGMTAVEVQAAGRGVAWRPRVQRQLKAQQQQLVTRRLFHWAAPGVPGACRVCREWLGRRLACVSTAAPGPHACPCEAYLCQACQTCLFQTCLSETCASSDCRHTVL